jgi:hypothetical protein
VSALDDLRALARARELVDEQVERAAVLALREGCDRGAVAFVLGVSRSQLYREFGAQIRQEKEKGSAS